MQGMRWRQDGFDGRPSRTGGRRGAAAPLGRSVAGSLAGALALGMIITGASAAQPVSADPGVQGLAKGRLVKADGTPAAGATVAVYATPVETATSHAAVGQQVPFTLLGQFRSDSSGNYAAAVTRAALTRFRRRRQRQPRDRGP